MLTEFEPLARALAVLVMVIAYYGFVVLRVGDYPARLLLRIALDRFHTAGRYSADELDSILRLAIAAVMQLVFCCVLVAVSGIEATDLFPGHFEPIWIVYGILLGIGDAATGSYLAYVAMQLAMQLAPARVPQDASTWLALSKGGWIRFYLRTAQAAPIWLALSSAGLYVAVEEIVFRGVLISTFEGAGAGVAIVVSVILFMVVQLFNMPSWQSAMFPVLGALVIGLMHASLYVMVPTLVPLIIAHGVAFAIAVL